MGPSRIQAIDHVILDAPLGTVEALRWFYTQVARLEEVPCDEPEQARLCFRSERIELRIDLVDDPRGDAVARRVTIAVPSLKEAGDQLRKRSFEVDRVSGLAGTDRRFQVIDPGGNRIVLKQAWPMTLF